MNALVACNTIRRATADDIPFISQLAQEKYPNRDVTKGLKWFEYCLRNPRRLPLVGPHSFGIAWIEPLYGFEERAGMDVLACRTSSAAGWEILRMVKIMVAWARAHGAEGAFRLDADTGVDFGPLAARLGGELSPQRYYLIPLEQ